MIKLNTSRVTGKWSIKWLCYPAENTGIFPFWIRLSHFSDLDTSTLESIDSSINLNLGVKLYEILWIIRET